MAVKNMLVLRWNQRHIIGFWADPKGTLGAPKGTVPFGKGLARTLDCMDWENLAYPQPNIMSMVDRLSF